MTSNDTNTKGNQMTNATYEITTFHDGYLWCVFINGDFWSRFASQAVGVQAAHDYLEKLIYA